MPKLIPILLAAPWIIAPVVTLLRARHSRSLDEEPPDVAGEKPLVSLVSPARNESHNIHRCLSSALASTYGNLEVIVETTDGNLQHYQRNGDGWHEGAVIDV